MSISLIISIVDGDASAREALSALVRALGFVVATFASAADFLEARAVERTDCLLADAQMPDMGGLELFLVLLAAGSAVPAILVTAYPDEMLQRRAAAAGVAACLVKPCRAETLAPAIRAAIAAGVPPRPLSNAARRPPR